MRRTISLTIVLGAALILGWPVVVGFEPATVEGSFDVSDPTPFGTAVLIGEAPEGQVAYHGSGVPNPLYDGSAPSPSTNKGVKSTYRGVLTNPKIPEAVRGPGAGELSEIEREILKALNNSTPIHVQYYPGNPIMRTLLEKLLA